MLRPAFLKIYRKANRQPTNGRQARK